MIFPSLADSKKKYKFVVKISNNWMSRYYKKNLRVLNVDVEAIQAFSQFYFFSHLVEDAPMKDVWTNYPEEGDDVRNLFYKAAVRTIEVIRQLLAPVSKIDRNKKKYDLMIVANGRHIDDLLDLIVYVKRRFVILVVGKLTPNAQRLLKSERVDYVHILGGRASVSKLVRLKLLLKYVFGNWCLSKEDKLLAHPLWRSRLWYLKLFQFPEIEALVNLADQLFLLKKPKIMFTTTSNDLFGSLFALTAKSRGIKVVEIQHGITVWKDIESEFYKSDHYFVWGKISKQQHPRNAIVVGSPYFNKSQIKKDFSKSIYSKDAKKILVLWTPPFGMVSIFKSVSNSQLLLNLITGLEKLPLDWKITLRSHPSFPLKDLLKTIKLPKYFKVDSAKNIFEAVRSNDIVITQSTTAGLVAIFEKKPLLYFDSSYLFEKYSDPYVTSKCALNIPVGDLINANAHILKLMSSKRLLASQLKAQRRFVRDYCEYVGQDSYEKIADVLKDLSLHE